METSTSGLEFRVSCRSMINKPPPFKDLDIRIPIMIPIKLRGFIYQRFGVGFRV